MDEKDRGTTSDGNQGPIWVCCKMTKKDIVPSAVAYKANIFSLTFQCLFLISFAPLTMSIEPFTIPSFTSEQLSFLKDRLSKTIYPNELEVDVGWKYGAPTWAVKPLVKAWLEDFDWEKPRKEMNQWHHYRTTIQGLKIHFVHEPSSHPDAVPLLLINGWPSTFYEYHKVIQPLRDGELGGQVCRIYILWSTIPYHLFYYAM